MNKHITSIKIGFCILFLMLSFTKASSQLTYHSVYDHHDGKIIDLDKLSEEDLLDKAANHHMWDAFETSDSIYGYLIAKDVFTINPEDTVRIGEYGAYVNMAHLMILKNKYKEAQIFLALAGKAKEPYHFCGNAYEARASQKKSYELLCQLALSRPSESKKVFEELLNLAFEIPHLDYGGEALVHYLSYWYGKAGMRKIIDNAQSTITAKGHVDGGNVFVDVRAQMLGSALTFQLCYDEKNGAEPNKIKTMALNYFKQSFEDWMSD